MWEKLKKHQDTVGFISAVVVVLGGLIMLIVNPQSVEWQDIPFFLIHLCTNSHCSNPYEE